MMTITTSLAGALAAVGLAASAQAQAEPQSWAEPYGWSSRTAAEPFRAAARGSSGNRLVVNGRVVVMAGAGDGPSGPAARYSAGAGALGGSTLRANTITAAAIGNSVDIRNVRNATIVIRQVNQGAQRASVGQGGSR